MRDVAILSRATESDATLLVHEADLRFSFEGARLWKPSAAQATHVVMHSARAISSNPVDRSIK
jgi:hypothetical protein